MFLMSIVSVALVFVTHAGRDEPYLQSKKRRVRYMRIAKSKTLSLNYLAFGPQNTAFEVIGNQWWQWQEGPGDTPPSDFDIKVVVYRNVSVEELTERFPLIEAKRMDSRYLKFDDAIAYLDKQIAADTQPDITARLVASRLKLLGHFGPSSVPK